MILILAEKPSQARNFGKALSGMTGIFDGEEYIIGHARGHLYSFADIKDQVPADRASTYTTWDIKNLPWNEQEIRWAYTLRKDAGPVVAQLERQAQQCTEICIATDDDPTGEGQLLAIEILLETGIHLGKKVTRMYFVDESPKEVQKAFRTRTLIPDVTQDPEYRKALFRSQWDYLSMQFTRIATRCGDGRTVLRQGRLKSAMVALVGDQLAKIDAYQEIPFYSNKFRDENGVVYTNPEEPTYPTEDQVPRIYEPSPVVLDAKTMKKTAPPRLIDLAGLSARLAGKGITAKSVLGTYQKLYESQIVSYPRTEDKQITPEQFNELLPLVDTIAGVVGVDPALLTHRTPRATHVKEGCAHGANRPGVNVPDSLMDLHKYGPGAVEIYILLAKSFLCMFAEDYEYERHKGHVEKYPDFVGTANVPVAQGWKAIDGDADVDNEESSAYGLGRQAEPFIHRGVPPKPTYPTMRWLMKQLEMRDVGTGATRTSIYADVTNPSITGHLLDEKKGRLSMTSCGEMSHALLKDTHIGDLTLTETLMADMRAVERGEKNPDECLALVASMVKDDIETMTRNGAQMRARLGIDLVVEKEKVTGMWYGRNSQGEEITFTREWGGHRFTDDEVRELLAGNSITVTHLHGRTGEYGVVGRLATQRYNGATFVGFEKERFVNADGSEQADSGDYYEGTYKRAAVRFKRSWGGKRFTDEQCEALCRGETIELDGLRSKSGSTYGVKGILKKQKYKGRSYWGFYKTDWL